MGGGAGGGLRRHQQWSPSWPPSWILPKIRNQKEKKIEIRLKPREMVIFCALHEQ